MRQIIVLFLFFFCLPFSTMASIPDSCFTVKSVRKKKNGVYVIYAHRNDLLFKIVSYFDGKKGDRKKKLVKGKRFQVSIESVFGDLERKLNLIPPCNEMMEFRGVAIGKEFEKGIDDVWFCKELNGPYLTK